MENKLSHVCMKVDPLLFIPPSKGMHDFEMTLGDAVHSLFPEILQA